MSSCIGQTIIDTKLKKPFRLIIAGGSGTGKTTFLKKLVDSSHFESPFDKIIYCYPDYLEESPAIFDQICEYRPGLGDLSYYSSLPKNSLIIYDDLMNECGNSSDTMKLFSVIARKKNLSVIFIVQNIYDNSKQFRNIRLNATSIVLFNFFAASDVKKRLIRDLALQSQLPNRLLDEIYKKPFAYIFLDLHPARHSYFGVARGNIFSKYFSVFDKMEYIAIPKAEFLKYFKIAEVKGDTIRAIKDEIEIRQNKRKSRASSSNKKTRPARKRTRRQRTPRTSESITSSSESPSEVSQSSRSSFD